MPLRRRPTTSRVAAFTVIELMTVLVVVFILIVMCMPVYAQITRRLEKTHCINNLRGLHVAAALYVQDHRMWPQVNTKGDDQKTVANSWINILHPYGLSQINWICPTMQKQLLNPDLSDPQNARIDYIATPFDRNPTTPMRWANQPWFVESGDLHGNGNLIIFPDGHTQEMGDFLELLRKNAKGGSGGK